MVAGTWHTNFSMAMGMQQKGIRSMAIDTRCSSDNLGTKAIYLYQWKTRKMQRTVIRPMATGAQQMDFYSRVEANHYMR